jgi:phosphatidylglycerol:prolipoprotein diacylglycerol transferase
LFPKLFTIGSFYLPTYGVLVALGFLTGLWITVRLARRSGLNPELVTNLAVYTALAGLLGAKLMMIAFDWPQFSADPGKIFSLETLQAAGVFQGGLILALITACYYTKAQKLPLLATSDAFAPGLAIGHAVGRLGCFAAGCCWGNECNRFWAVTFHNPEAYALTGVPLEMPLHPSQLYEFTTEAILFVVLYNLYAKAHPPGRIIGLYLVFSSIARFLIEFTRFHAQGLPFGLPLSITQWIAIGLALAGFGLLRASKTTAGKPAAGSHRPTKVRPQTA